MEQASFIQSKTTRIDPPVGQEISSEETPHANEMNNNLNKSIINVIDQELALSFKKHFEHSLSIELSQREYLTKTNNIFNNEPITQMNSIIGNFITDKESLTYWEINCIQYAAAITLIERNGKLKHILNTNRNDKKRRWITEAENQINRIRQKISYITLMLDLHDKSNLTNKQKNISNKVRKICENLRETSLQSKLASFKHDLRICNTKLKDDRKKAERSRINSQFSTNQKQVFRNWRSKNTEIKNPPSIDNIKTFWANIWEKETPINLNTDWHEHLKDSYVSNVTSRNYVITNDIFNTVMSKMANNKAPGTDSITAFWIKKLTSVHPYLLSLLQKTGNGEIEVPEWLATSMTNILPKNADSHLAKNYRPIACQNITYKLYTGILNHFLYIITVDHCS